MLGLTAMGSSVPFGQMASATALATLLLLIAVAVIGLMNVWNDRMGYTSSPILLMGAAFVGWQPMTALLGSTTVPWIGIAGMVLLIGGPLALTAVLARTRDFCAGIRADGPRVAAIVFRAGGLRESRVSGLSRAPARPRGIVRAASSRQCGARSRTRQSPAHRARRWCRQ